MPYEENKIIPTCKATYSLTEGSIRCELAEDHTGDHIFSWGNTS